MSQPAQPRVLVLDDSKPVHERIRRAFQGRPITIEATDSLATTQAAVLSSNPPDLLILDLEMPMLGGALVGRSLKRRASIPIVIFSSESAERLAEVRSYVGAEAALSKSVSDHELVETVERALAAARAGSGARG